MGEKVNKDTDHKGQAFVRSSPLVEEWGSVPLKPVASPRAPLCRSSGVWHDVNLSRSKSNLSQLFLEVPGPDDFHSPCISILVALATEFL